MYCSVIHHAAHQAMTNAENQASFRARLETEGGKAISVFLQPEAYKQLLALKRNGESTTAAINRLLLESDSAKKVADL